MQNRQKEDYLSNMLRWVGKYLIVEEKYDFPIGYLSDIRVRVWEEHINIFLKTKAVNHAMSEYRRNVLTQIEYKDMDVTSLRSKFISAFKDFPRWYRDEYAVVPYKFIKKILDTLDFALKRNNKKVLRKIKEHVFDEHDTREHKRYTREGIKLWKKVLNKNRYKDTLHLSSHSDETLPIYGTVLLAQYSKLSKKDRFAKWHGSLTTTQKVILSVVSTVVLTILSLLF